MSNDTLLLLLQNASFIYNNIIKNSYNSNNNTREQEPSYASSTDHGAIYMNILLGEVVVAVLVNALLIYALISTKKIRQRASDFFMLGLFVSYTIYNIAFIVFLKSGADSMTESTLTKAMGVLFDFWFFSSLLFVILLSIDRYLAIMHPFFYDVLTWRSVAFSTSIGFLLPLIYTLHIQFTTYHVLSTDIPILIVLVTLTTCNLYVYREAKRQLDNIAVNTVCDHSNDHGDHRLRSLRKQRWRTLKICFSMVATTCLLRLPHSTVVILDTYKVITYTNDLTTWLFYTTVLVENLNSIVDPILFGSFNHEMRRTLTRKFRSLCAGKDSIMKSHCFEHFKKKDGGSNVAEDEGVSRKASSETFFLSEVRTSTTQQSLLLCSK